MVNTSKRVDVISKELAIQSKSLDEIFKLAKEKDRLLAAISTSISAWRAHSMHKAPKPATFSS